MFASANMVAVYVCQRAVIHWLPAPSKTVVIPSGWRCITK